MSVFRNKSEILLLEPCDGKLSRTVLRGESARKGADLPAPYHEGGQQHGDRYPEQPFDAILLTIGIASEVCFFPLRREPVFPHQLYLCRCHTF